VAAPLTSADINGYVKERIGSDFTAKDFRTLRGTVAAAVSLARSGPQKTVAARKHAIGVAMQDAAAVLGNTPSIARKSYVDPRLLDHFADGETIDPRRADSAEAELRACCTAKARLFRCGRAGEACVTSYPVQARRHLEWDTVCYLHCVRDTGAHSSFQKGSRCPTQAKPPPSVPSALPLWAPGRPVFMLRTSSPSPTR
jgi:hypothetical protein